jgi:hypothetical protein
LPPVDGTLTVWIFDNDGVVDCAQNKSSLTLFLGLVPLTDEEKRARCTGSCCGVRSSDGGGYYILYSNGSVYNAGDAVNYGNATGEVGGYNPATTIFTTVDGKGYWIVSADGSVITEGDAPYEGGANSLHLNGGIIAGTGW